MREISTSILSYMDKIEIIEKLNNSNTDYIHLDIMDGTFVENKFLSKEELQEILPLIKKPIDVHFMVNHPEEYINLFDNYNVKYMSIHIENENKEELFNIIRSKGITPGIVISPSFDIESSFDYLDEVGLVQIMSVIPGGSGREFIKGTRNKIEALQIEINKRELNTKISVDGGINNNTLEEVKEADILVSGSYILKDLNNINILKE